MGLFIVGIPLGEHRSPDRLVLARMLVVVGQTDYLIRFDLQLTTFITFRASVQLPTFRIFEAKTEINF
ncbi:MAG: hypothetical protein ACFFBD_02535 [Candidatus Hodarchaeota archaeon]